MAIDYKLQQGETTDAYNARIATARGDSSSSLGVSSLGLDPNTVLQQMQNQVGSVSSSNNSIDTSINSAIESQKSAAASNAAALESQYGRESGYMLDNLTNQRTSLLESTRGGAYSGSALTAVDQQIEKSLRDLEQRKNELVLQGNSAAASKISDLQVQQLQFKQQAQQQVFTNLLNLSSFNLQSKTEDRIAADSIATNKRLTEQFAFSQQQAISALQLQFPEAKIPANATYEQAVQLAMPIAATDKKREDFLKELNITNNNNREQLNSQAEDNAIVMYGDTFIKNLVDSENNPIKAFENLLITAKSAGIDIPSSSYNKFITYAANVAKQQKELNNPLRLSGNRTALNNPTNAKLSGLPNSLGSSTMFDIFNGNGITVPNVSAGIQSGIFSGLNISI